VSVEGDGVGARYSIKKITHLWDERRRTTPRGINMKPHALALGHRRDLAQRVNHSSACGPGCAYDHEGQAPFLSIDPDCRSQSFNLQRRIVINFDLVHSVRPQPAEARRFQKRVMALA
jgi:hypothetical protein